MPRTGGRKKGTRDRKDSGLVRFLEDRGVTPPDEYLVSVYLDENEPTSERVKAAAHLMPYCRKKMPVAHDVVVTTNPVAELLEAITSETMQVPALIDGRATSRDK